MIGLSNWSKFTKSSAGGRLYLLICVGTLLLFIPGFAQAQLFDIALSSNAVEEGAPPGTLVGTISTPGILGTVTYILPADTHDNDLFSINEDQLLTAAAFDYEIQQTYTITIEASLLGLDIATEDFVIDIVDAETMVLDNNTINENEPSGTLVGIVSSTNEIDSYTFLLPSGQNDNDLFSITDDQLVSAAVFDYETQTNYTVTIHAIDESNQISSENFIININDVGPTDLTISKNSIDENLLPGAVVGSFSATNAIAPVTYSLVEGSGASGNDQFFIDGDELKTDNTFDYEMQSTYSIRVQATDATTDSFAKSFSINVNNLSEGPTDITLSNNTIEENQPTGTPIGTLSAAEASGTVTYSLPGGENDNDAFSIDGDQLQTNDVFDFETQNSYTITVQATDEEGSFEKNFTINVTDLEEGPTDITLSSTSVDENQPEGTTVGTFSSQDGTSPYSYSLVNGAGSQDNGAFSIDGDQLQTNAVFDFETKNSFSIRVQTTDDNGESLAKTFTISVDDLVEAPTDLSLSASIVDENKPIGTPIGNFSSEGGTAPFIYQLVSGSGDEDNDQFLINGDELQTNAVFDFETKSSFSIRAQTTDDKGESLAKAFTISVDDVEEAPTDITLSNNTIEENAEVNTPIGTLSATDAAGAVTYSLPEGQSDNELFSINEDELLSNAVFDFEDQNNYTVSISATDENGSFEKTFSIQIEDIQGISDFTLSNNTVEENQAAGATVGDFSASGNTGTVTYTLPSGQNDNDLFSVDGNTLTANEEFDFETKSSYTITVEAQDAEGVISKDFTINVTDLEEGPTDITLSSTSVDENQPEGTTVGTFSSQDGTSPYSYSLVNGAGSQDNGAFSIDGDQLQTNAVFDFETKNSFSIRAQTTDDNGESLAKAFTISVDDLVEAPTDLSLSASIVDENKPIGTPIGNFSSEGGTAPFIYQLVSGSGDTDNAQFLIDDEQLKTNAVFDFETKSSFSIRAQTTDDKGESLAKAFTISVDDVEEAPTDITLSNNTIEENQPAGTVIGTLSAAEASGTVTYSLPGGENDNDAFSIDGDQLLSDAVFDFEAKSSYTITVEAQDAEGVISKDFTINVTNVSEAPQVVASINDFSVNEDAPNSTFELDDVFSHPNGDELTYSVQNNNATLLTAAISGATLTLDYQPNQSGQATITVAASDGNENVQDEFVVTVTAVNDTPTASGIEDINVNEDASPVNVNLYNAFADVEDADEALTYNVVSNSNAALLSTSISKPNLTLSFAANQNGTSNITVEAVDTGGASVQTSFKVTVSAVNDKPTVTAEIANVNVAENAEDVEINLFNTFADVENTDAQLTYQVTSNSNPTLVSTQITNPELILSFAPNSSGSANLTIRATDTGGEFVETSFTVNVTETASTPVVANPINDFEVNENADNSTIDLSEVFSDSDGDELTYSVQNDNEDLLTATISGATLTLEYQSEQSGQATITVTASDGSESVQDVFVVTVNPINNPPSFVILGNPPASKEDAGSQVIRGFVSDIQDGDEGSQNLSFELKQTAFTGMLAFASGPAINVATGDLTYTAAANAFGTADYDVTLKDDGPSDGNNENTSEPQSFTIVVEPVADPPVVPTDVTIDENETASELAVERNAVDSNEVTHFKITNITGGTLYQNDGTTNISNGTFITVAQGSAGLKFTPGETFTPEGSFTATASTTNTDAGLGGASTAQLEILPFPDKPVVTHATTEEDTQTTSGLVIDRNPNDGGEVTEFRITNITGGQLFRNNGITPINNGEFISYEAGKAGLKFTPSPNSTENGSFTVQASALLRILLSDTAVAVIKVTSVNDAPVVTAPSNMEVDEDATLSIPDISVEDVDLGDANLSVTLTVENGILTLSQTNGLTFSSGSNGSASMTVNGNLSNVNNALETLKYQGNEGFSGTETLQVTASDNGATGEGGEQMDTASVTITVNPVNDPPVLSGVEDKSLPYTEDAPATTVSGTITVTDPDSETMLSASVKITANYTSNEDKLVFPSDHPHLLGSFAVNTGELKLTRKNTGTDFSVSVFQSALRAVQYQNTETANPSAATRTVTFTVTDDEGETSAPVTRNITITLVNDPPALVNIESDPLIFTPNTIPQISKDISVTDVDGGNIVSASIKITQNYKVGEDVLNFTPINGIPITGTFFSERGELVLTGTTTLGNYTTALRNVKYLNINAFPTSSNRLVTFSVRDIENNKSNDQSRFITIGSSNVPPSIFDFEKQVGEDTGLTFTLKDFEDAYFDEGDTPEEIRIRSVPQHGRLELNGNEIAQNQTTGEGFAIDPSQIANLVYIPDENYSGEDNFKWNASDGSSIAANDAFVDITIDPVNDEPVINAPSNMEVDEDVPTVITNITVEDPDAGNGILTVTLSVDIGSLSLNETSGLTFINGDGDLDEEMEFDGTLTSINNALNTLTYLSQENFSGDDKLRILVEDNGNSGLEINFGSDSKIVALKVNPVNDPPVLANIETEDLSYKEKDPPLQITGNLTLEDVDEPEDAISQAIVTIAEGYTNVGEELLTFTPSDGISGEQEENVLTLSGTASLEAYQKVLRTVMYENQSSNPGDTPRMISIQLIDEQEGESNVVTRNINITPVNDPPVLVNIETEALPYYEGQTAAKITSALEASDPDDDNLSEATIQISENYVEGEDSLSVNGLVNITASWDRETGTLTLSGADAQAQYQEALRSVNYHNNFNETPNTDTRTISFQISDGTNQSEVVSRELTILPNDPPVVSSFEKSTDEDEALSFTAEDFSAQYEDDDIPTEGLAAVQILSLPPNGSLLFDEEEITQADIEKLIIAVEDIPQLVYLPNPDFNGEDSIGWTASDGIKTAATQAYVRLTVNPVNDPPTVGNFSKTGEEDTPLPFTASEFNDHYADVENDGMQKVIIRGLPTHGELKLNGFTLPLNAEISTGNLNNLVYEPEVNYHGEDSIRWSAADPTSVSEASALITLTIAPVNDAPEVVSFTKTSNENAPIPITLDDFSAHFNDVENDELQKVVITRLPVSGMLSLNENPIALNDTIDREDLENFVYVPDSDFLNGRDNFRWKASDGSLYAQKDASVNIIIGTGVTDFEAITDEDTPLAFTTEAFANNFNNASGGLSVVRIDSLPDHGTLTLNEAEVAEGQTINEDDIPNLVYTPAPDFNGKDSLYWNGRNGGDFAPENAKVLLTVNPVNDAPVISEMDDQFILVNQSAGPLAFSISDVDSGPETLIVTVSSDNENLIPNQEEHLTLIIDESIQYSLNITPLADSIGSATITISASDGKLTTESSFTLHVVNEKLEVDAGPDLEIVEGESAEITATPKGGDAPFTFTWTCDQPECAIDDPTQATINVSPLQTTTYFVEVSEAKGQKADDAITVNVTLRPTALDIPSGFTPDGVEPNNLWIIDDIQFFENVLVEVYNRYGTRVFRSEGYSNPWDGTYNGDLLPVGTYYYVVNIDNGSQVYKGSVVILR